MLPIAGPAAAASPLSAPGARGPVVLRELIWGSYYLYEALHVLFDSLDPAKI
jgi:hypothetical protein